MNVESSFVIELGPVDSDSILDNHPKSVCKWKDCLIFSIRF